ncbi:hypothetical protein Vadar_021854 [Vaccinium darrowii]|uniref:Uncharacterized protein n=1 Tax=Vaccinium darrowii TaxID=229202 RepID=A0ACB7Y8H6_9ERIC|nr:hypothetical protein Vadar_021854 [Vaccinium darrowii]
MADSCGSRTNEPNSSQSQKFPQLKAETYHEILQNMKEFKREELSEPGFKEELWNHINRLPIRYAMNLNIEGPEDILMHMKLLQHAYDSATKSAFAVRIVEVPVSDACCSSRPTLAFGLSPSLELAREAAKSNCQVVGDGEKHYFGHLYEITISTVHAPKLLSQLMSLLSEIGHIQEAHAFSTIDGYSLSVFVVDSWSSEVQNSFLEVH